PGPMRQARTAQAARQRPQGECSGGWRSMKLSRLSSSGFGAAAGECVGCKNTAQGAIGKGRIAVWYSRHLGQVWGELEECRSLFRANIFDAHCFIYRNNVTY